MPSYYAFPGLTYQMLPEKQRRRVIQQLKPYRIAGIIKEIVADFFEVTIEKIDGSRGGSGLAWARQVFCYCTKRYTFLTLKEIGELIHRDHTTIIHSIRTVQDNTKIYDEFRNQVAAVELIIDKRIDEEMAILENSSHPNNSA